MTKLLTDKTLEKQMAKKLFVLAMIGLCVLLCSINTGCSSNDSYAEEETVDTTGLPVDITAAAPMDNLYFYKPAINNEILHNITTGDDHGLNIDLNNSELWGKIYTSPYPFEAGDSDYDYANFRVSTDITDGKGNISIYNFYKALYDSNSWNLGGRSEVTPTIAYRLELFSGKTLQGMYGSFASFSKDNNGVFVKLPTIVEGPFVTNVSSENPTKMEVVWRTDEPCSGKVYFGVNIFNEIDTYVTVHSVTIDNLSPDTEYEYYIESESQDGRTVRSNTYNLKTAPTKGHGDVKFVYASDSYKTEGGGEKAYMGVNYDVLNNIAVNAYRDGAEFIIFGGDLVEGFSSEKEDIVLQYRAWKQVMSGYWHSRPVYTGMGNHEFLMNFFEGFVSLDKWPYETDSSEAVFAQEFYNPLNGPDTSDSRRPTYKENVYHFQYGPVKIISFNTNYWQTTNFANIKDINAYGGAPFGYIMQDQMDWILDTLEDAEKDNTVKFIFLFTHCPILPYMKHVEDSMWWDGNNNIRALTRKLNAETNQYELQPEDLGMIQVRDRLLQAVADSTKVAAIFTSHEHGYHRTLISKHTPLGVYPKDDTDGDDILDQFSTNPNLTNATWHIMSGGGGSGFNAEDDSTPWKAQRSTSHPGYVLIETKGDKVSMKCISGMTLQVLDELDDLMDVK